MKNRDEWKPSKFVRHRGRLRASRDRREVGVASRLMADAIAAAYDEALPRFARGRLLDLGCGKVPLYEAYRDRVSECVCVDWGNTLHPNPYLDRECDLTEELPFPDQSFDTLILSDVLEHLPEPLRLWREMARVLRPDGHLLLNVPFFYWLHEQPHDFYRYTRFALSRFAAEVRLEVPELRSLGGATEIMADVFAKNALRVPRLGGALAAGAQTLAGTFSRTRVGRKVAAASSQDFPFAYFMVARKPSPPSA